MRDWVRIGVCMHLQEVAFHKGTDWHSHGQKMQINSTTRWRGTTSVTQFCKHIPAKSNLPQETALPWQGCSFQTCPPSRPTLLKIEGQGTRQTVLAKPASEEPRIRWWGLCGGDRACEKPLIAEKSEHVYMNTCIKFEPLLAEKSEHISMDTCIKFEYVCIRQVLGTVSIRGATAWR